MSSAPQSCPICGSLSTACAVSEANRHFLIDRAVEGKLDGAISLARIIWQDIPQLRNVADSEIVGKLSKSFFENVQKTTNQILEPMRAFVETFPKIMEKLPNELREDINGKFDDTRIAVENGFKALIHLSPKSDEITRAIQALTVHISDITKRRMDEIEQDLSKRFKETLEKMGFPEPEQLKLLAQLIPSILPLLEELVRFQEVPAKKGKQGELELMEQLREYYPEDECEHVGGSGDMDILAIPRFNSSNLTYKILIESKKNGSGWNRSFIQQTRTHMKLRGERFAILAVDRMPKGANGFLFEQCPEGVVLITDREYFKVAYGSLRASLITLQPFDHKEIDFGRLFADQKISEAAKEAYNYCEWVKKIREKARRIETSADGIGQDIDELDKHLKRALNELQTRINNAITQIAPTEDTSLSPYGKL